MAGRSAGKSRKGKAKNESNKGLEDPVDDGKKLEEDMKSSTQEGGMENCGRNEKPEEQELDKVYAVFFKELFQAKIKDSHEDAMAFVEQIDA